MAELVERMRAWITPVEAAYADGGYAAGDGPEPPLDEMVEAADRIEALEALAERRQRSVEGIARSAEHWKAERDAEAALADRLAFDYLSVLREELDWVEEPDGDNLPPAIEVYRAARVGRDEGEQQQ